MIFFDRDNNGICKDGYWYDSFCLYENKYYINKFESDMSDQECIIAKYDIVDENFFNRFIEIHSEDYRKEKFIQMCQKQPELVYEMVNSGEFFMFDILLSELRKEYNLNEDNA